jgi:uncharacterized phage protein (TIGR02216 family)
MTPRELASAIEARAGRFAAPLRRADFATLMERYPDGR